MGVEPGRSHATRRMAAVGATSPFAPGPGGGPFALLPCSSSWSSRRAGSGPRAVDGPTCRRSSQPSRPTGAVIRVYPTFGSLQVAFTTDGKRLIAGLRHAQLWDITTGKRVHHFGPFGDLFHAVEVSPDGKYLVTGHMGSDGRIWEIDTGTFFRRLGKNVDPPG
jgi:WD40 repeat protein